MTESRSRVGDLADRYWQTYVAAHPATATSLGEHRYDDRMDDLRPEAAIALRAELQTLLDGTAPIVAAASDPTLSADAVTAIALQSQLEGDIAEIDADLASWTVDPVEGPQIPIFNIESFQPVETVADGRAMVARWRAMGPLRSISTWPTCAQSADSGRVAVRHAGCERHRGHGRACSRNPTRHGRCSIRPALEHPEWPPADLARFREDLRGAVADVIRPALARLRTALARRRSCRRPGATSEPGLVQVPRRCRGLPAADPRRTRRLT